MLCDATSICTRAKAAAEFKTGRKPKIKKITLARWIVYFEGMLSASGVFTEVGHQRGDLSQEQYDRLKIACNPILDGVIPKAAFWLRPTVDTCMQRIKKRGREIEDGIQRDFITALDDAYEVYFNKYCKAFPVIEIDNGSITPSGTRDIIQQLVSVMCQ